MLGSPYLTFAAVCFAGLVEGFGIPWPGAFIIAGAAVSLGDQAAAVPAAAGLFTLGYCVGSLLQYLVGWLVGPVALSWLPTRHRGKLDGLIEKYGLTAVLWLRPVAIGNYISLPAGMMRMPLARFTLYTVLGIAPWAVAMALGGRFLGGQVDLVSVAMSHWFAGG